MIYAMPDSAPKEHQADPNNEGIRFGVVTEVALNSILDFHSVSIAKGSICIAIDDIDKSSILY